MLTRVFQDANYKNKFYGVYNVSVPHPQIEIAIFDFTGTQGTLDHVKDVVEENYYRNPNEILSILAKSLPFACIQRYRLDIYIAEKLIYVLEFVSNSENPYAIRNTIANNNIGFRNGIKIVRPNETNQYNWMINLYYNKGHEVFTIALPNDKSGRLGIAEVRKNKKEDKSDIVYINLSPDDFMYFITHLKRIINNAYTDFNVDSEIRRIDDKLDKLISTLKIRLRDIILAIKENNYEKYLKDKDINLTEDDLYKACLYPMITDEKTPNLPPIPDDSKEVSDEENVFKNPDSNLDKLVKTDVEGNYASTNDNNVEELENASEHNTSTDVTNSDNMDTSSLENTENEVVVQAANEISEYIDSIINEEPASKHTPNINNKDNIPSVSTVNVQPEESTIESSINNNDDKKCNQPEYLYNTHTIASIFTPFKIKDYIPLQQIPYYQNSDYQVDITKSKFDEIASYVLITRAIRETIKDNAPVYSNDITYLLYRYILEQKIAPKLYKYFEYYIKNESNNDEYISMYKQITNTSDIDLTDHITVDTLIKNSRFYVWLFDEALSDLNGYIFDDNSKLKNIATSILLEFVDYINKNLPNSGAIYKSHIIKNKLFSQVISTDDLSEKITINIPNINQYYSTLIKPYTSNVDNVKTLSTIDRNISLYVPYHSYYTTLDNYIKQNEFNDDIVQYIAEQNSLEASIDPEQFFKDFEAWRKNKTYLDIINYINSRSDIFNEIADLAKTYKTNFDKFINCIPHNNSTQIPKEIIDMINSNGEIPSYLKNLLNDSHNKYPDKLTPEVLLFFLYAFDPKFVDNYNTVYKEIIDKIKQYLRRNIHTLIKILPLLKDALNDIIEIPGVFKEQQTLSYQLVINKLLQKVNKCMLYDENIRKLLFEGIYLITHYKQS